MPLLKSYFILYVADLRRSLTLQDIERQSRNSIFKILHMSDIEGFILAGGASSRMGQTKANLSLGGKTFVERSAAALSAIADRIFIVGNAEQISTGLPVLADIRCDKEQRRAAIFGLHTALVRAKMSWVAILACDLPLVTGGLFERLSSFDRTHFDALSPLDQAGVPQPLCAFYRRDACLPMVETMLRDGDWSLQNLLRSIKTHPIKFDEISDLPGAANFFMNVNTPEDYEKAEAILQSAAER